ncbi:nuclear transport factor 2 family protein [Kibdelosporangium aridum]|uniref:Ketosteroid isomerase-related protein n=1 Tax=Kibdelosporangium aridum TaxID=2030 RepID=A0A1W1ZZV3_KIBAR|nr:nuclear transport factor 2 family protein [Kibdelosporangium aridum]SMC53691.1 Ketosteroid isomerase-related protein [Kibdelosporangium aridum]
MSDATPSQVVSQLIEFFAAKQFDKAADLYSDDAVLVLPLAQPNAPIMVGGAGIRKMANASKPVMYEDIHVRNLKIRTTADPEVVIAEWDYAGVSPATGKPFETGNLIITRVRDGKIVSSRDYHDHVVRAWISGDLDTLLAQLAEGN